MNLAVVNTCPGAEAHAVFRRCCGSTRWADAMTALRPFDSDAALFDAARRVWWSLSRIDWLEAFAAHPKIGDLNALRARFATTAAWSAGEQAGVTDAGEEVLRQLALGNCRYEERFGFIFIICATGKTAGEMLEHLEQRLSNEPDAEIALAAAEQAKITRLRLEKIDP